MIDKEDAKKWLREIVAKKDENLSKLIDEEPEATEALASYMVGYALKTIKELDEEAEQSNEVMDSMLNRFLESMGDKRPTKEEATETFVQSFDNDDAYTGTMGRMVAYLGLPLGVDSNDTRVSRIINLCKEANRVNQA